MKATDRDRLLGAPGDAQLDDAEVAAKRPEILSMPIAELARAWRSVQSTGYREVTPASWAFGRYFDGLGHGDPERAMDLIAELVAREPDDGVVALVGRGKLLGQLLHFRGADVVGRLEQLARNSARARWLIGSVHWMIRGGIADEALKQRLLALSDRAAFAAWKSANTDEPDVDLDSLSVAELAALWVRYNGASPLAQERMGRFDLFGMEDQDRLLALVIEIRRIEDDPRMLGVLSAGPLEDLVPAHDGPMVDKIVAAAKADPAFAQLLGGVWYNSVDDAVMEKLRPLIALEAGA